MNRTTIIVISEVSCMHHSFKRIWYFSLFNSDCPALTNPDNGHVTLSSSNSYLGTATYFCNEGFVVSSNEPRTCTIESVWSEDDPECLRGILAIHVFVFKFNLKKACADKLK